MPSFREELQARPRTRKAEKVRVPEWDRDVWVRAMSADDRDSFEESIVHNGKAVMRNVRAKIVVRCSEEEDGTRVFEDGDAAWLGELPAAELQPIFDAAQRLNKMSDSDVKELAKN